MRRSGKIFGAVLAAALVVALGAAGLQYAARIARPKADGGDDRAVQVRTAPVRVSAVERAVVLTGEILAAATVDVAAKMPGRLERLELADGTRVDEGTAVKRDATIAVLEHEDLRARLEEATAAAKTAEAALETARASLSAAEAALASVEVSLADAKRERERVENLFREGSATERGRELAEVALARAAAEKSRAEAELGAARARAVQAEAALEQARAAHRLAQVSLEEAFVKSPLDGVVSRRYVDPGAVLGPAAPIVRVEAIDRLKVLVAVPAEILPRLSPGTTPAELAVDSHPGRRFPAQVAKVYPAVDPATRTATVEIAVENERDERGEPILRPGLYATARIVVERKSDAVVVPTDALVRRLEKHYAFVVEGDVARRREVRLGLRTRSEVEVLEGLSPGEELVTSGQERLTDGSRIHRVGRSAAGGDGE
ncbi:MAG: efflux RND transporter periplasmic adaptor subunit [Planctomycetota bacterium]